MNTDNKKYKVFKNITNVSEHDSIGKMIVFFGILAIICILTFLVAKYIVRSEIDGEKIPIDTSERL